MPLVEVVHDAMTSNDVIERGAAFCNQINRFPLAVTSTPGFLVNRVLAPYMQRALHIHQQRGVPKEALDQAAVEFGMPMGPVELADTVGLDVGLNVIRLLGGAEATDEIAALQGLVDAGKLGKKSGEGFYTWQKGKPVKDITAIEGINLKSLATELLQPYFEECQACLADGVVESADFLDAGMIFGTGFAPFRGGPLHYLASHVSSQAGAQAMPPFSASGPAAGSADAGEHPGDPI
jgi:3-hydroxyacyl-CoA dehydrogenase/enoyl-CoA hydratase/3-hydroxybutyryl-CoA epimerase